MILRFGNSSNRPLRITRTAWVATWLRTTRCGLSTRLSTGSIACFIHVQPRGVGRPGLSSADDAQALHLRLPQPRAVEPACRRRGDKACTTSMDARLPVRFFRRISMILPPSAPDRLAGIRRRQACAVAGVAAIIGLSRMTLYRARYGGPVSEDMARAAHAARARL